MAETMKIDKELCLNFNYKKMKCQKCHIVCPSGCISEDLVIKHENCSQCGLCIAACPVEAVAGISYTNRVLDELNNSASSVALSCKEQQGDSAWPCLGFLTAPLITAWGYRGLQVVVDSSACMSCNTAVANHLNSIITETNALLALYNKPLIQQGKIPLSPKAKNISRRAFFGQLFGAAVDTVREVAHPTENTAVRLACRNIADPILQEMSPAALNQPNSVLSEISVSDACQACGLCAKFCMRKAISLADRMEEIEIFHDPRRCSGCEVCAAHCPVQAIKVGPATRVGKYKVKTAKLPRCSSCNELFQPVNNQTVCLECMLKGRKQTLV